MSRILETIAAPITGSQAAAVAIIRISGPEAWSIAAQVFQPFPTSPEGWRVYYGRFSHGDDGLLTLFPKGRSYTGEASAELSVHGSSASVRGLMEEILWCGARSADPGEFTLRAFLNGRIDLTQAEGVAAVVESQTELQLKFARRLLDGEVKDKVQEVRHILIGVLARIEAAVDFSEETGPLDAKAALQELQTAIDQLSHLIQLGNASKQIQVGRRIVLAGQPNAGKSSLFNALLRSNRAIVTPHPGTTRDTIEEVLDINGAPVVLIDTAGLRETTDEVERIGMDRTREAAMDADEVWLLYDASIGWTSADEALFGEFPSSWVLATKSDLGDAGGPGVRISTVHPGGIKAVLDRLRQSAVEPGPTVLSRHTKAFQLAQESLQLAEETILNHLPSDLAAVDVSAAHRRLGEVTGETAHPDVIQDIFRRFCIGK